MELFFKHFWPLYVTLGTAHTDKFTNSKINGDLLSCKEMEETNLIINIAIYLDFLTPIKRLPVSLQEERHNCQNYM